MSGVTDGAVDTRARLSLGRSHDAIYRTVSTLLEARGAEGTLADVGCGTGDLWRAVGHRFSRGVGIDAVRYDPLPPSLEFNQADLDRDPLPLSDGAVDVAAAVEVVEHLENPRALFRELARVVRPGGWIVVTTPNQLSLLSLVTLAVKARFSAFQDAAYPAHRTALLAVDLMRIAGECTLRDARIEYTGFGRVPLTPWHYPGPVAHAAPRWFSDNVILIARR